MTKHYVEFLFPGIIVSESEVHEIKNRDVKIKPPKGAYAYQYFDREEAMINGEKLTGERKNQSGTYYIGGVVKTCDDIQTEMPDSILAHNMKFNKIKRVVITTRGQAMELHDDDVVVPA